MLVNNYKFSEENHFNHSLMIKLINLFLNQIILLKIEVILTHLRSISIIKNQKTLFHLPKRNCNKTSKIQDQALIKCMRWVVIKYLKMMMTTAKVVTSLIAVILAAQRTNKIH